jgi:hypothetical protein
MAGLLLGACYADSSAPAAAVQQATPERKPEPVIWRTVGSWTGQGNTQTGSFSVETGAMRIRWETRNERPAGAGIFRLSLHSAISGRPLQVAVDHPGVGKETTYIQDEPRVSYLVVDSRNVDWAVTLEEAVPATVEPDHK